MAEPVRVLHVGDVHLGVELYGRPDPEKGYGTRVGDFLASLDHALEHAAQADLVLFPGDIYKNCDPTPTVQREFAARIRRLARSVPVVIIPGNHDLPNAFGRASSVDIFHVLELDNVWVLRRPAVEVIPTRRGNVLIAPLPFMPRSRLLTQDEAKGKSIPECTELMRGKLIDTVGLLTREVEAERERLGAQTPAILMAHYTIQGAVFGGYGKGALLAPEVELPLGVVKNEAFDYVALAHIHQHQSVPMNDHFGQPPVVYPGSIDRVDFGEESEDKVVVLAEVTRGRTSWSALPLKPRPFVTIRLALGEEEPLEAARLAIEKKAEQLRGAVVRVIYTLPQGLPNLPERDLRMMLEGVHYVAGIRRESQKQEVRARHDGLTTQLTPLEALQEYLRTQPQLAAREESLLEYAKPLIAEVTTQE
ncbi:MAG: metallophosphoesterase family protein [Actinomycetota bacterium]